MNMDIQDTTKVIIERFVLLAFLDFNMAAILVIFCIADLFVMYCAWLLCRNVYILNVDCRNLCIIYKYTNIPFFLYVL